MSDKTVRLRSYADFARKRVESLEAIVLQKLHPSNSIWSLIGDEGSVNQKARGEFYNYLKWLKHQLQRISSKTSSSSPLYLESRSGNSVKLDIYKRKNSTESIEFGYSSDISSIIGENNIFSSLNSPKYFDPVIAGKYSMSFFLQLVVEIYCNKLDPDLFWLSRDQVERVLRSPNNSLLKYLIIDSSLNVSTLTKREKSQISFLHQDISSLTASCYNNVSLDSVVALAFLATEEYLKYNITSAKMFLGKAFRLADLLRVNPDFRDDIPNFFNTSEVFNKDKLWESLLLIHGYIFFEVPGPPFGKCSTICSFPHVGSKELSFPTISRVLEVPASEKIQIQTIFQDFSCRNNNLPASELLLNNVLIKHKRRTVSGTNLRIYMETLQIYMKLYQFSLEVQHQYFANPYKLQTIELFLPRSQKRLYSSKLVHMLENLPSYFISPQVLTIRSLWEEFSPNISKKDQECSTLGNLMYVILLSCLINVNYPHIWFDPQPLPLPDSESWQLALKGSDAIFHFFLAFSSLLQKTKYTDFLVFNLGDSLSAIYTYLNAILNCPYISQPYRYILFDRAQTIVNEIKLLSRQEHQVRHTNAKKVLVTLEKSLVAFRMPKDFQLVL